MNSKTEVNCRGKNRLVERIEHYQVTTKKSPWKFNRIAGRFQKLRCGSRGRSNSVITFSDETRFP